MSANIIIEDGRIQSFGIGGYRSFGSFQQITSLDKVNVFIGPNNNGKSNVLKFVDEHFNVCISKKSLNFDDLDGFKPIPPKNEQFQFSFGYSLPKYFLEPEAFIAAQHKRNLYQGINIKSHAAWIEALCELFKTKANADKSDAPWVRFVNSKLVVDEWEPLLAAPTRNLMDGLKYFGTNQSRVKALDNFENLMHKLLSDKEELTEAVVLIPAVRNIGGTGTNEANNGTGLIEKLRRLERPSYANHAVKVKFEKINQFVRAVTGDPNSGIEIAADEDEILVHLEGRLLPIESLGSGIHEVVILASNATILENRVVCIEEPETHLSPTLQKKLLRYLNHETSNQYFITTHSASIIDRPSSSVYEVRLEGGESKIRKIISSGQHSSICLDLGYRSSDIVQSNCVIWVEGPSDRVYIREWIRLCNSELIEGIDYTIMFYGGKLLSHLSGLDNEEDIDEFIAIRRLNRRAAIVIDSDKKKSTDQINETKQRVEKEFSAGNSICWVTDGTEIENYLEFDSVVSAAHTLSGSAEFVGSSGKWKNPIEIITEASKKSAKKKKTTPVRSTLNKVKLARYMVENEKLKLDILNLNDRIEELCIFIINSNSD